MSTASEDTTAGVTVNQRVGTVSGGKVTGIEVANQIADTLINQTVVDRRAITNNILVLNDAQVLNELVAKFTATLGVDKTVLQSTTTTVIQSHVGQQIDEVAAAQQDVAAQGIAASAQTLYDLGMLMAYRRNLDAALDYFRQAAQAQPDFANAHEAIAWLQQSRANNDLFAGDGATALTRLNEARAAIVRADQSDARVAALAGYIAQKAAHAAQLLHQTADAQRFRAEGVGAFQLAAKQFPDDATVLNGLAETYAEMGDYDAAIHTYKRAIQLKPDYASAYNDLALAYEAKLRADSAHASQWCARALAAWKEFYRLAPNVPTLSDDYMAQISRHILSLENECAQLKPRRKKSTR